MTEPKVVYGFMASTTTLPLNSSAFGRLSLFLHGIARSSTSPNLAASSSVPARAPLPASFASFWRSFGCLELKKTTCPALAQYLPRLLPTWPEPKIPIFIVMNET
jgi:hypothetical protein